MVLPTQREARGSFTFTTHSEGRSSYNGQSLKTSLGRMQWESLRDKADQGATVHQRGSVTQETGAKFSGVIFRTLHRQESQN